MHEEMYVSEADLIIHGNYIGFDFRSVREVSFGGLDTVSAVGKSAVPKRSFDGTQILEGIEREVSRAGGSAVTFGNYDSRLLEMSDFFKKLFTKKMEEAMQRRAEDSRKDIETKLLEEKYDDTRNNLYSLLDELRKKTNNG